MIDDGLGVRSLPLLSREQEAELVARVRAGDAEARHRLLLGVLRRVTPTTVTRLCKGEQGVWRVEFADVMQEAYMALWEEVEQVIRRENAVACLITRAQQCIWHYIQTYRSLVLVSASSGVVVPPVESLDVPLQREHEDGEGATLAEHLVAPVEVTRQDREEAALYEALRKLPVRERRALVECYGVDEEALGLERGGDEEMEGRARINARFQAVGKLRKRLAAVYPQYAGEYRPVRVRPALADVRVTPAQRERLEQAYQRLGAQGGPVTARALAREARVSAAAVIAYVYHKRKESVA